jgi:putative aldouronate transport system permease protein
MILILNEEIDMSDVTQLEIAQYRSYISQIMRYGLIVVASLPMLIAYPFVQRYFVKGVMIGALKG